MSNEHSKSEYNGQTFDGARTMQANVNSTGSLQRPLRNNNPPYQNPTQQMTGGAQRRFPPVDKKRKSTYDVEHSPAKLPAGHSAIKGGLAPISPTRKTRGRGRQDGVGVADLRRSPRKSQKLQMDQEVDVRAGAVDETRLVHEQHTKDGDGSHAEVAEAAEGDQPGSNPVRGGAGRRKRARNAEAAEEEETTAAVGERRGPGRPRKSVRGTTVVDDRQQSALANLHKRKSQGAAEPAKGEAEQNAANNPDTGHVDDGTVVPSAVTSANVQQVVDDWAAVPESSTEERTLSKKRTKDRQTRANTSSKRSQPNPTEEEEGNEVELEEDASQRPDDLAQPRSETRWFGQYRNLKKAFIATDKIGRHVTGKGITRVLGVKVVLPIRDKEVKSANELCWRAVRLYRNLKDHTGEISAAHDPAETLYEISDSVDELRGVGIELDEKNTTRCSEIYSHLVPSLLNVLEQALICYEKMDEDREDVREGQITFAHLQIVTDIVKMIVQVIAGAQKYKPRPDPSGHVVEPVRNLIHPPLRQAHQAFRICIHQHTLRLADRARREEDARQSALRLEQEERRSRQEARTARFQDKWRRLHVERRIAEGGIPEIEKLIHLELPKYDIDQNGQPFERAQIFHPRVGPPPGLVDWASKQVWKQVEASALADGLREYAGPLVLERVIRKYCGRGGELNRFNVTQIVTTAAMLRGILIDQAREGDGDVPAWVEGIPVWTNVQQAIGKENEDDARGDGEVRGEGEADGDDVEIIGEDLFVR